MKKLLITSLIAIGLLSGCVSMDKNVAVVKLQAVTAKSIGLGSSDEITVSRVKVGEKDFLGGQEVTYRATTTKGRSFDCKARLMAGATLLMEASVTSPTCTPISVHK